MPPILQGKALSIYLGGIRQFIKTLESVVSPASGVALVKFSSNLSSQYWVSRGLAVCRAPGHLLGVRKCCINYDMRVAADEIQVSVAVCKKLRDNVGVRIEKNCPDCISRAHYSALRSYNTQAADKQNRGCSRTPKIRQRIHLCLTSALEITLFALRGE